MDEALFNALPHLDRLLDQRGRLVATARELQVPNPEDDELIRCGMIGFAQHVPLDRWDSNCFQYVRALRDEVRDDDFSTDWQRFTCLAGGYFLGMQSAGLLGDQGLRLAEAQTPGYMWLHSESFDPPAADGDRDAG